MENTIFIKLRGGFLAGAALISVAVTGCASAAGDAVECDDNGVCAEPASTDGLADSQEELTKRPGGAGGNDCALIQCNGLVNPFGTMVCVLGMCVCKAGTKAGVCKPGETVCKEQCSKIVAQPPGGIAP